MHGIASANEGNAYVAEDIVFDVFIRKVAVSLGVIFEVYYCYCAVVTVVFCFASPLFSVALVAIRCLLGVFLAIVVI